MILKTFHCLHCLQVFYPCRELSTIVVLVVIIINVTNREAAIVFSNLDEGCFPCRKEVIKLNRQQRYLPALPHLKFILLV